MKDFNAKRLVPWIQVLAKPGRHLDPLSKSNEPRKIKANTNIYQQNVSLKLTQAVTC
jgi:hypothetical protein